MLTGLRLMLLSALMLSLLPACGPGELADSEMYDFYDQVDHGATPDTSEPVTSTKLYYFQSKAQVIAFVEAQLGVTWEWSDNPANLVIVRKAGAGYKPGAEEQAYDDLFIVVDRDQDNIHHFSRGNAEGTNVYSRKVQYGYTSYRDPHTGDYETPALAPGQYRFKVDLHRGQYKALWVYTWDYDRLGLPTQRLAGNDGDYYVGGVNVHKGGDTWNYSVGCLTQHYSYWDEFISHFDMGKWGRVYLVGDYNGSFQEPSSLTPEQFSVSAPSGTQVGTTVTFSGPCTGGIYSMRLEVDGVEICRQATPGVTWSCDYAFNTAGQSRQVVAYAFGDAGQLRGTAQTAITVVESTGDVTINADDPVLIEGETSHFSGFVNNLAGGRVVVDVDGTEIFSGSISSDAEAFSFTYTFDSYGTGRLLRIRAYTSAGSQVAEATQSIDVQASSATLMTVSIPDPLHVGSRVTFAGIARNIVSVTAEVDGWSLGTVAVDEHDRYYLPYTFNNSGTDRNLVLTGLDANGNPIPGARLSYSIDVLP